MSVTFFIEGNPTGEYAAECYDVDTGNKTKVAQADSYDGIVMQMEAHQALCETCNVYGIYANEIMDVSDEFDVNLANTNAIMMLEVLGIDVDDYDLGGSMPGDEFLGHVLTALAVDRDDSGISDVVEGGDGRATVVHCGLPAGYWSDRLNALHDLAQEASRLGRDVVWS